MTVIRLETFIKAPIATCFDLARSIDFHLESAKKTQEKVVAGRTSGLCELGDQVTWEAVHFGIKQQLSVEISALEYPNFFEDRMLQGAFKTMVHKHFFSETARITTMTDEFSYSVPFGFLGKIVDLVIVRPHMVKFLLTRNETLKIHAESMS